MVVVSIRKRALIADGSALNRKLLALVCAEAGYHTLIASDGNEALQIIDRNHIDLLVTDLDLGKIDGLQLLHIIADRKVSPQVLILSQQSSALLNAAERLCHRHGFTLIGAIHKPVVAETLLDLLLKTASPAPIPADIISSPMQQSLSLKTIEQGIEGDAIAAFYQPKVSYRESKIVGFECLARWKGRDNTILGPDCFIPVAEANDLMIPLTRSILDRAVRDMASWRGLGWDVPVSINLSTDNLIDTSLPDYITMLIALHKVPASLITLEITETKVMEEATDCLEVMSRLRLKGFGLSVDDFGTGYSTLKQLQYFPFTELKLDLSYVKAALTHGPSRTVLETGIHLARGLSLTCVAEGVGTLAHADLLGSLGCETHQGFLYARPMAGQEVPSWIAGWLGRGGALTCHDAKVIDTDQWAHRRPPDPQTSGLMKANLAVAAAI